MVRGPPSNPGLKAGFKPNSAYLEAYALAVVNGVIIAKNTFRKVLILRWPRELTDMGQNCWSNPIAYNLKRSQVSANLFLTIYC